MDVKAAVAFEAGKRIAGEGLEDVDRASRGDGQVPSAGADRGSGAIGAWL